MPTIRRIKKGDRGIYTEDYNRMARVTDLVERLAIAGGSFSFGSSGLNLHIPEAAEIFVGKASQTAGGYPSFDNDRRVFPVQCYIGPYFDPALPLAAMSFNTTSVPEIQAYNLANCWIFENSLLLIVKLGGFHWTWNNQKRTGQIGGSDIAKGSLGDVDVQSLTIQARAKFGPSVSGKSCSVYHDGTEWVIDAEECP